MVLAGHARIIRIVARCAKNLIVIDSDSSPRYSAKSAEYRMLVTRRGQGCPRSKEFTRRRQLFVFRQRALTHHRQGRVEVEVPPTVSTSVSTCTLGMLHQSPGVLQDTPFFFKNGERYRSALC